jgi:hypothetical protein
MTEQLPWVIVVFGGRDFDDLALIQMAMSHAIDQCRGIDPTRDIKFIAGEAKGADFLCRCLAKQYGFEYQGFPADWGTHGRSAGSIRNQQMIDEGRPDFGVAMPGGRGTNDMFYRLQQNGVWTYDFRGHGK